jgi:alkylhydroperoxidase/carboxymuconolactone decarboxylase family protein YurZ
MTPRLAPAERPYAPDIEAALDKLMPPGMEPLLLFRVLARDPRLFRKFMGGSLLDRGTLSMRDRELAIARTCARCRGEYEWGVHMVMFGEKAGFSAEDQRATLAAGTDYAGWSARDRAIVQMMDALHEAATIDDALWPALRAELAEEQVLELIMLAGFYRNVCYITNALRLAPESFAARFPAA